MSANRPFAADRPAPRYVAIESLLSDAIGSGRLPPGTVLTEEPIARIFGTSRTPVRTALGELLAKGLLKRFEGRGFLVNGAAATMPLRTPLTHEMLGLEEGEPAAPQQATAARIISDFEEVLTRALPFGLYRINEQAAADHYDVSRTVIRELLSRFQDRGLVGKDRRSHWIVGPLTARDIAHHFAVRGKLEPLALEGSAPHMPAAEIDAMSRRLEAGLDNIDELTAKGFDDLETDLHVRLLARAENQHLLRMIHQSQLALVVNRMFVSHVGARAFRVPFREHAIVLEFIMRGSHGAAAAALEEHLTLSAERTRRRLMATSVFPNPTLPKYLVAQAR
ncbi:MAG: GntR family transcriptional regulator [Hyphomicrobiales bacterium]|nr:GntR family transcriptional regulator [Hyphomicrobiales bacterium]